MKRSAWLAALLIVSMVAGLLLVAPISQVASGQATDFILNVAVQDEMKTRNMIRVNFITTDVWTADVLNPVTDTTVQTDPATQDVLPYVMVGTDQAPGNGGFDTAEIGVFDPVSGAGTGAKWVAFYDIRGLRFHDGTAVTMEDILFGYHLEALSPAIGSARFVKDLAGLTGTNFTADRWLAIRPVAISSWRGAAAVSGQFALEFTQTGPNAAFDSNTFQTVILPRYFWEGTGVRKQNGNVIATGFHPDFGVAICDATKNGVPANGQCGGQTLKPFDLNAASQWAATDADVIGTGPFKFETWQPGIIARVVRNDDYFLGADPTVVARTLQVGLRKPALDAMVYRLYRNVQAGIFAVQSGEVDFTDWFVPPEFVGPLLADPNVGLKTSADAGYFYIGYNMRRLPFGYLDPGLGSDVPGNDIGRPFRIATAHAIDKRLIVTSLLQNFGVPGHTAVSPTNTLYYNASAARYDYDPNVAKSVLDAAGWADPPGDCQVSGAGCRSLPGKGTTLIEILTPQADYDPVRAAAGTLIAQNLRAIGLNVNSKPTAFGQIVTRVFDEQDFDIWILGWSLTGYIAPSYMESFYHSRNTVLQGDNAQGYTNSALDKVIDDAIGAADPAESVRLWKYAQGIVNTDMSTDTLYFRTNIFAFRQDKINGDSWQFDIGGDVFVYWSWIKLDRAPPGLIRASASAPSAVASGGSASVTVTVRDPDGNRLSGATVTVSVAPGDPGSVSPASGTTNANGEFTTTFNAPTLIASDSPATTFLNMDADHPTFGASREISIVMTTFPPGAQFLATRVDTPFGNAVSEGGAVVIDVSVTDETGLPASGVAVGLIATPATPSLGLPATATSDASGRVQATGTAPSVTENTAFTVSILATRGGVSAPQSQVTVTVLNVPGVAAAADITVLLVAGGVVGVGAAGGAYYGLQRRRRKK